MICINPFVVQAYVLLLRLYPRQFRDEFEAEMRATFAEAIAETANHGFLAVSCLCLRELCELPVNLALEHWARFQKESLTMNSTPAFEDRPLSWFDTCIGLIPFLLFGPVTTLLAYPFPYAAGSFSGWFARNQGLLFGLCFLVGLVIGPISGWQRWSFSYLGLGVLVLGGGIWQETFRWVYTIGARRELSLPEQFLITVGAFALVLGLIVLTRAWRSARLFYVRLRLDWTQLSFGLYVIAAIAFCGIDHEEDPELTLLVILPGVFVLLSALAYLRSQTKNQRVWSLLLGVVLVTTVSTARHWFFVLYGIISVTIIFLPALLELLPQRNKTMLTE